MGNSKVWLVGLVSLAAVGCAGGPGEDAGSADVARLESKEDGPLVPFDPNGSYAVAIQNLRIDELEGASPEDAARRPLIIDLNGVQTAPCADNIVCYESPSRSDWLGDQRFSGSELQDGMRFTVREPGQDGRPRFGPTEGALGAINAALQGTGTYRVKIKMNGLEITGVTFEVRLRF